MPSTTVAQFHGVCTECDELIAPGQRIEHADDDAGWRHVDCHALAEYVGCVCDRCFLIHAPNQEGCQ